MRFSAPSADYPVNHEQRQQRYEHYRNDRHCVDLQCVRRNLYFPVVYRFYPVRPDKQAVGIDTVRGAGHKRYIVRIGNDLKLLGLTWQDYKYLFDLIGVDLVEYVYGKRIALHHLVEVGKKLSRGESSVP